MLSGPLSGRALRVAPMMTLITYKGKPWASLLSGSLRGADHARFHRPTGSKLALITCQRCNSGAADLSGRHSELLMGILPLPCSHLSTCTAPTSHRLPCCIRPTAARAVYPVDSQLYLCTMRRPRAQQTADA